MASRSVFLGSLTSRIKSDHAYRSGVKVGDRLFCTIESDNKPRDNTIVIKSRNDNIVGHVPETLSKKLFNFMTSQQIEIMDSKVTGDPRPAPEGKWVNSDGIEMPCKYKLFGPKNVKKEVRAALK